MRTSGLSIASVAAELGLHETVLRKRVRAHSGMQAPSPSPSDLASENARLRREREHLRMERDILKKTALIFGTASRLSLDSLMRIAISSRPD